MMNFCRPKCRIRDHFPAIRPLFETGLTLNFMIVLQKVNKKISRLSQIQESEQGG